ncbi:MAG: hypothetical protein HY701_07920 [Gemmatimonadetes bacterium]|nr:hypothetical protein [Gemmatimonadota bacterium]
MAENPSDERLLAEQVNRRYWDGDQSVNQIADELQLSKGVLYELLDLLPAGLGCPRCGQELGYANRTARDKGFVTCAGCGFEDDAATVAARAGQTMAPTGAADEESATADSPAAAEPESLGPAIPLDAPNAGALVGAALIGLAVGLLLGGWIYRHRHRR